MAQRAFSKKHDPGTWGPAVAGTVEAEETYLSNIIKETWEEIGLEVIETDLIVGPKERIAKPNRNYFTQWFLLTRDIDISELRVQTDEVEHIAWRNKQELLETFAAHPEQFVTSATTWLPMFCKP